MLLLGCEGKGAGRVLGLWNGVSGVWAGNVYGDPRSLSKSVLCHAAVRPSNKCVLAIMMPPAIGTPSFLLLGGLLRVLRSPGQLSV